MSQPALNGAAANGVSLELNFRSQHITADSTFTILHLLAPMFITEIYHGTKSKAPCSTMW